MTTGKTKTKITADFVLDVYEQSKKTKGKEAQELLQAAISLSKHLNEWLVVPTNIGAKINTKKKS
jgi:hypothetical protein